MTDVIFYIMGAISVASALGAVAAKDPLRAALSLIVCFVSIAVLYVLLSAHFIAAIQLIVYAGAIMVFFVIVIMMLDPGEVKRSPRLLWSILGLAGAGLVAALLIGSLTTIPSYGGDITKGFGTTEAVGGLIFRQYVLPFEILSFLLLAAMVGAVVLVKKRETEHPSPPGGEAGAPCREALQGEREGGL